MPRNLLDIDIVHPVAGAVKTTVLCDPTPRQLTAFIERAPGRQLRGTACSGRLLVYPAYDVTHHQIRAVFSLPGLSEDGTDFWVIPHGEEPLSQDWSSSDDNPVRNGIRLIVGRRDDDPAIRGLKAWFGVEPDQASTPAP